MSLLAMYDDDFMQLSYNVNNVGGLKEKKIVLLYDYIQLKFKVYWNKLTILKDANCVEQQQQLSKK